ncbi:MAG: S49 family peptidase [Chromatiales bacterium]|jgi:protease-4
MSDSKHENGQPAKDGAAGWERELLNKVVMASMTEARRSRRWGIFFKLLTFSYLFLLLGLLIWSDGWDMNQAILKEHTALVEVNGLIAPETKASADLIVTGLRNAFEDKKTKGVILRLNTPGGSPVQSRYINEEISRLKEKYPKIPIYAVVVDMCASGGYYIAAATDKIYADVGSIVGSIGVLMNGFGFVQAMDTIGIERRLMTAGEHKAIMDPFSPLKAGDREHMQRILNQLHEQFIEKVKEGRGDRLKLEQYPEVFSGLFWSGEEAKQIGLIDDFGNSSYVAREVIGVEDIVDFTPEQDVLERLAKRLGAGATEAMARLMGLADGYSVR